MADGGTLGSERDSVKLGATTRISLRGTSELRGTSQEYIYSSTSYGLHATAVIMVPLLYNFFRNKLHVDTPLFAHTKPQSVGGGIQCSVFVGSRLSFRRRFRYHVEHHSQQHRVCRKENAQHSSVHLSVLSFMSSSRSSRRVGGQFALNCPRLATSPRPNAKPQTVVPQDTL